MPTITRLPDEEAAFMRRLRRKHADRPPGLHVTDAIWCNIRAIVKPALLAAGIEVPFSDTKILQFEMGKLWEGVMTKGDWHQQQQIESPDDDSLGTFDAILPRTRYPVEAKTTKGSSLAELSDATMMQVGEYAARLMLKHWPVPCHWEGYIRILHINGDCGKNKCPAHGYPETEVRRLNPDSNRQRTCCPVCEGWLSGDQSPEIRHYKLEWPREELLSLHYIITWRLAEVKAERIAYQISDYAPVQVTAPLPTWQWGYPKVECNGCEVRELVGCPGRDGDTEGDIEDALVETGKTIEEIQQEVLTA